MHTLLIEHCNTLQYTAIHTVIKHTHADQQIIGGDMPRIILTTMWNPNCYSTLPVPVVCVSVCVCVCVWGGIESVNHNFLSSYIYPPPGSSWVTCRWVICQDFVPRTQLHMGPWDCLSYLSISVPGAYYIIHAGI